jgi:hypothetical protein
MKKTYLIALLCSLLVLPAMSQTQLLNDTSYGGQQQATNSCRVVIPARDTVKVSTEWSTNGAFVPLFVEPYDLFINPDSIQDTILVTHVVDTILIPAPYHFRMRAINISTGDTVVSGDVSITVLPLVVAPTISIGVATCTGDGGVVPVTVSIGNETSKMRIFLSLGDSSFALPYLVDSSLITSDGTFNYVFTGISLGTAVVFSFKFEIENSLTSDTSGIGAIQTCPVGNPWISNVDSAHAGVGTIDGWWSLVTRNTNCSVTTYCRKTGTTQIVDSVVQFFAGQNSITLVYAGFTGLLQNTSYDIWSCVSGGNCGVVLSVTTLSAPILLTLSIDTAVTTGFDTELFAVVCTTETDASIWIEVTDQNDPNFSTPFIATVLMLSSQGISTLTIDGVSNHFLIGETYLVRARAFNIGGESATSPTRSFIFNQVTTGVGIVKDVSNIPFDWRNNNTVVWKGEQADVSITDMSGRVVEKRQMQTGDSWNIGESVASGAYLIHYGSGTKKVIVTQ